MAKSFEDIIDDTLKPRWIQSCEPIEGTDFPEETVTIDESDGSLTLSVSGVSNRPNQDIYGIAKLLALLASDHHYNDGSHHIDDPDVIENAGIQERLRKLDLDFYGIDVPDEDPAKVYSSTEELSDKIQELFTHINILRKGLGSQIAERLNFTEFLEIDRDFVGFKENPNYFTNDSVANRIDFPVFINYTEYRLGGKTIQFRGTNKASDDGSCNIDLSDITNTLITSPEADVVWAEVSFTTLSTSYVPYGNLQFGLLDSYSSITPAITAGWVDGIAKGDHNIVLLGDDDPTTYPGILQLQYKLVTATYNPNSSTYGVDISSTSSGQGIVRSSLRGVWEASDSSCYVIPVAVIGKRNGGIYHNALNPGGTATVRTGVVGPTSISECFEQARIGYFLGGVEHDYMGAYDTATDTYALSGTVYYRSGLSLSEISLNPDGFYADKIYTQDIVYTSRVATDNPDMIVNNISEKLLATDIYTRLNPVLSGSVSSNTSGLSYARRPMQVVGFGTTEIDLFGLDNNGGIFVDKTNNNETGISDLSRTYWADLKGQSIPSAFGLVEGVHSSETKSYLSYEPSTQTVTINTTSLSGPPLVSLTVPVMYWQDGSVVTLNGSWSGLGTSSVHCVINITGHSGHVLYGTVYLDYAEGGGIPYVLDDIVQIEDTIGNTYEWCYEKSTNFCIGCMWDGNPTSGTSLSFVLPECIDCDSEDELIDGWVSILESTSIAGEFSQIESYDDATRTVTVKTAFTVEISDTDTLSIGKLKPETKRFVIIPFSRGVRGVYTRKRVQATASGIYTGTLPIVQTTSGDMHGTVVTGLNASQYFEIVVREEEPLATGFYITFYHNPQWNIFDDCVATSMEIVKPGIFVDTTKGSANEPYNLYQGFIPACSTKIVDDVKWISASCNDPYFNVTSLEYNRHFDIRPTEKLDILRLGTLLRTDKAVLGDYLQVLTNIAEATEDYRLIMGTILVNTSSGYRLLVALRHVGAFGFHTTTNCFFIDVDPIY